MKKLMMIAAMAVATLSANAQTEPGTFSIIPRIGGTGSLFTKAPQPGFAVPGDFDKTARGGNFTGVDFEYRIAKQFSMSAGVNFSDQGMEWKELKKLTDTLMKELGRNSGDEIKELNDLAKEKLGEKQSEKQKDTK